MTCGLLHVGKGFIDLQTVRLHIYILHRMSSSFYFEFVLTRRLMCSYPVYVDIEGILCSLSCTCGYRRFIVFCILYMWIQKVYCVLILYMWIQKVYHVLYPVYVDIEGLLFSVSYICGYRKLLCSVSYIYGYRKLLCSVSYVCGVQKDCIIFVIVYTVCLLCSRCSVSCILDENVFYPGCIVHENVMYPVCSVYKLSYILNIV